MNLIERLRDKYKRGPYSNDLEILLEAADELEAKDAAFQALCDEHEKEVETVCELRAEIERLERVLSWLSGRQGLTDAAKNIIENALAALEDRNE